MAMNKTTTKKQLSATEKADLLSIVSTRFEKQRKNGQLKNIDWFSIEKKLKAQTDKLWSLSEMEKTGGEPSVVAYDEKTDEYVFVDCSAESPKGRRSLCYDAEALASRKEHKPKDSAIAMAAAMGIDLLDEDQYRQLQQQIGPFDTKTSSWIKTPSQIRQLGGALFCDRRYDHVFVYHNGAESYYAGRAFRGMVRV
jgi:hypothetical protein